VRVREGCSYVGPLWEDVLRFAKRAKIDAEYAHWWYGQMDALGWCNPDCITDPVGNWRSLLRAWWLKRGKSGDDWKWWFVVSGQLVHEYSRIFTD